MSRKSHLRKFATVAKNSAGEEPLCSSSDRSFWEGGIAIVLVTQAPQNALPGLQHISSSAVEIAARDVLFKIQTRKCQYSEVFRISPPRAALIGLPSALSESSQNQSSHCSRPELRLIVLKKALQPDSAPSANMSGDNVSAPPLPTPKAGKPVSEALLNDKWDRAISSLAIRSALGFSFGVIFSVLLFKRRAWPVWLGTGFGAGRAWEEADANFKRGDRPFSTDGLRKVRTER